APLGRREAQPQAQHAEPRQLGDARIGYPDASRHRRKMRLALVPPKPMLLVIAVSRAAARGARTSGSSRAMPSGSSRLAQPATNPRSIMSRQKIASWAPDAAMAWPLCPLVDERGGGLAPNTERTASSSARSPARVEVACALR